MRLSFTSTTTVLRQLSQNQRFQTPHNVSVSRNTTTITKSPPHTLFSLFRNLSTATSKIHKVTTANFESVVLNAKQPIIVDCMVFTQKHLCILILLHRQHGVDLVKRLDQDLKKQ